MTLLRTVPTPEALTELLQRLNDEGQLPTLAGVDDKGSPFLADLAGIDADYVAVVRGNPWDSSLSYDGSPYCRECQAHPNGGVDRLDFPVAVIA